MSALSNVEFATVFTTRVCLDLKLTTGDLSGHQGRRERRKMKNVHKQPPRCLAHPLRSKTAQQLLQPCISNPPVPCIVSPVKYDPKGDARKTYAVAISTGIPGRCRGAASTPSALIASGGFPFVAG